MEKTLTNLENELLNEILSMYDEDDNICFDRQLTNQEKGVISSLIKKELIYDSFEGMQGENHNYFPVIN